MTTPDLHLVPDLPWEGGCLCGAVRYRLVEDPIGLHVCHCTNCQKITGSAFITCMPVHRRALELVRGSTQLFAFTTIDGLAKREQRCAACGSCLWGEIADLPLLALQAGTLDDTSWLRPIAHIWTRSAQPWIEIPDDVLVYEQQPEDDLELVRAWKNRNAG